MLELGCANGRNLLPMAAALPASATICGRQHLHRLLQQNQRLFEIDPNNSLAQANGPIASGVDYHGYQNDASDYFTFFAAAGGMSVDLTHNSAPGTQLQFYYESTANPVGYAGGPPYHINYNGAAAGTTCGWLPRNPSTASRPIRCG